MVQAFFKLEFVRARYMRRIPVSQRENYMDFTTYLNHFRHFVMFSALGAQPLN